MKLSNEEWILKVLNKIEEQISIKKLLLEKAKTYIEDEYQYGNKKEYLDCLRRLLIPQFFCLDVENREVKYLHFNILRTAWHPTKKIVIRLSRNKSDTGIFSNIVALMSGKKQDAVAKVAKSRRNIDGSYKGMDKTHHTKMKNGVYQKVVDMIAISRRNADGSYKGSPQKTWSPEKVLNLLKERNLNYKYLETEIKGSKEKVRFICDNGHSIKLKTNALQSSGVSCPICQDSKDEKECREILENMTNLKFPKVRLDGLRNPLTNKKLELDGYCEELKLAFEFDGPTHYQPIYGMDNFKKTVSRDLIKNKLCSKMNIFLIRIPYKTKNKIAYIKGKFSKYVKNNK